MNPYWYFIQYSVQWGFTQKWVHIEQDFSSYSTLGSLYLFEKTKLREAMHKAVENNRRMMGVVAMVKTMAVWRRGEKCCLPPCHGYHLLSSLYTYFITLFYIEITIIWLCNKLLACWGISSYMLVVKFEIILDFVFNVLLSAAHMLCHAASHSAPAFWTTSGLDQMKVLVINNSHHKHKGKA